MIPSVFIPPVVFYASQYPALSSGLNAFEHGMARLLYVELAEAYYCEHRLEAVMDRWAEAVISPELKQVLLRYKRVAACHLLRLEAVFSELALVPKTVRCRAMHALLQSTAQAIGLLKDNPATDHAVMACAQKAILMEVASYRSLVHLSRSLGLVVVERICAVILAEEMEVDRSLHACATGPLIIPGKVAAM